MHPVRIALCTDTHAWTLPAPVVSSWGSLLHVDRAEEIQALLIRDVAAAGVDCVLHLGDMTNGGGYFGMPPAAFAPQMVRIKEAWSALPVPVYPLPGNHDCPPGGAPVDPARLNGQLSDAWRPFERLWGLAPGQGRTLDVGPARLIQVNTQGHSAAQVAAALPDDPVYGWVSDDELARVEDALDSADGRPVILLMHQLLQEWRAPLEWRDFFGIRNRDALMALAEKYGSLAAVFQGHAHFYEVQPVDVAGRSVPFVVAPAAIEAPLGWLLLTLDADGLQVELKRLPVDLPTPAAQGWRAGRPEWATWRLPWALNL